MGSIGTKDLLAVKDHHNEPETLVIPTMTRTKLFLFLWYHMASMMGAIPQPTSVSAFSILSQMSLQHRRLSSSFIIMKTPYYDDGDAATTTTALHSSHCDDAAIMSSGSDNGRSTNSSSKIESLAAGESVTANDLRMIVVTDSTGQSIKLGDLMRSDKSQNIPVIVVFLRHLGCFHCWSYAREWIKVMNDEIRQVPDGPPNSVVVGPIFVSIGDENRLMAFLDKHPDISPSQIVVDGYDFAAYKQAGFGRFDQKPTSVNDGVIAKPINLGGWTGWWTFLTSFMPLAPVTPEMKFSEMLSPEGLFWVGGTIVIRGDEIVYRWDDRIAGDYPDASKVLAIARDAAEASH
jgi:hypothetical protein